jgi:hypothetical protein
VALDSADGAPRRLNLAVAVCFLAALGGIVALALRAPRRPRLMQLLFLTVLAFLLTNKVWSPQFSLWLVPLALLARPRWGPLLAWQAAEGVLLLTRFYFFVSGSAPGKGIRVEWFLTAVLVRDLLLLGLAALVVRDVLRPELDVVRRTTSTTRPEGSSTALPTVVARSSRRTPSRDGCDRARAARGPALVRRPGGAARVVRLAGRRGGARDGWRVAAVGRPGVVGRGVPAALGPVGRRAVPQGRRVRLPGPSGALRRRGRAEAFFPGAPLVLRAVHVVVPDWTAAGLVVSLLAGAFASVALGRLAVLAGAPASRAVLYLVLSPYAVFLFAGYSESLFLALALWGWVAAREERWGAAALLVAGASTVRFSGLFLACGLLVHHLVVRRSAAGAGSAVLLLPFAAVGAYFGYLWATTGDPLRWFAAQEAGWGRRTTPPWEALATTARAAVDGAQGAEYVWSFRAEILAVAVGLVLTVVLVRRRAWGEATYVGLSVGALATSTYYLSVGRATLLWWPLFVLLALATVRRPWLHTAYVAVSAPVMALLVLTFTSGRWVG